MVQVVMGFLDDTPDIDTKLTVIETLRTVTEGKVDDSPIFKKEAHLTDFRFLLKLRGPA